MYAIPVHTKTHTDQEMKFLALVQAENWGWAGKFAKADCKYLSGQKLKIVWYHATKTLK